MVVGVRREGRKEENTLQMRGKETGNFFLPLISSLLPHHLLYACTYMSHKRKKKKKRKAIAP